MFEWLLVCMIVAVGALGGYLLGHGTLSTATPSRLHKTIELSRSHTGKTHTSESDLTEESSTTAAVGKNETHQTRSRSSSTSSASSTSSGDEIAAEDEDEDLETTLALMKQEHSEHLAQFQDSNSNATSFSVSPDPASPPIPQDAHRRIFIVAKMLPLRITNLSDLPRGMTPAASPRVGPAMSASSDIEGDSLSLDQTSSAPSSPVAPKALSKSISATWNLAVPKSKSVVIQDGSRFRVEWNDDRSYLSNLRCLLMPKQPINSSLPAGFAPMTPDQPDVKWVGLSNVTCVDGFKNPAERLAYEATLTDNNCIPVYLDPQTYDNYHHFCTKILWPLLHYMMPTNTNPNVAVQWHEWWSAYQAANQVYADVICDQMKKPHSARTEEPIIWIHNMHLFCVPQLIRRTLPRATIGLFIHTPFPSSDVFRSLPSRKEVLESIMESDLLGFHTFDYARHFLSCIKRVMDLDYETLPGGVLGVRYNGRFVSILISHVGIQSQVFKDLASSDEVVNDSLRAKYPGKKIIVGVDDVDVAKAPILKLQAFDRFLSRHPEWISKIVILEMFLPSKNMDSALGIKIQGDLDNYILELKRKYGDEIIQIISPSQETTIIKDQNGAIIEQSNGGLQLTELVRLYNAADVALISTFFDGLNLIPFEFTASQNSSQPGALIISEFMGCSRSLNGVLRVNPYSLEAISEALNTALSMSIDERRANHSRRYNYVMHHTVERWANGFLEHLSKATKLGAELHYVHIGHGASHKLLGLKSSFVHLPTTTLTDTYTQADLRVIFLDYDGTLVAADKIASDGKCLQPPPAVVIKLLKFLSEDPNTIVFLMSGRTRSILSEWFGHLPNLGIAAEKGLFLRWPQRIASACRFDRKPEDANAPIDGASSSESESEEDEEEDDEIVANQPDPSFSAYVQPEDWECIIPLEDTAWRSTAADIIRAYTEQTDGSWIEDKEFAIVWHYEQCDPEFGRMQASDLQKYLVKVLANPKVDVLRYDKSRILEIKPHGVNKGLAATAILESLWIMYEKQERESPQPTTSITTAPAAQPQPDSLNLSPVSPPPRTATTSFHPFVLAIGDDRSDEEMFIATSSKSYLDGRVRGREPAPLVTDSYARAVLSNSTVPTSFPQTPAHALHDHEESPTPISPTFAHLLRTPRQPSTDPFIFTVCVGMKPSNAHYYLNTTDEVLRSLYGLVLADQEMRGSSGSSDASSSLTARKLGLAKRTTATTAKGASTATGGESGLGPKRGSFGALTAALFGKKD